MIRDTRQAILDTAKNLFNEQGYNNVSTRDIAEVLGISKGNLTYHFKKKEEIIEAILAQSPNTRISKAPENLLELNDFFKDIEKTVQENAFYFWHYTQLAQLSPKIQKRQQETFQENINMLTRAFKNLAMDGVLREESFSGEYEGMIDTLQITSIYWIPFCRLKGQKSAGEFSLKAFKIMDPLLTDKGKNKLGEIMEIKD